MMNDSIMALALVFSLSYLLGAVPTAYIIARLHGIDIFAVGSGNMGGTNAARALGFGWGVLTSLLDIAKGIVAVLLARYALLPDHPWAATTGAALGVIIGHNWSIFATLLYRARAHGGGGLRGGKGAATAFGTLIVIAPLQIIFSMVAMFWLLVLLTRYVSLGVLAAFALGLGWLSVMVIQGLLPGAYMPYSLMMGALISWRFRENVQRLVQGKERRLGDKR